MGSQVRRRQRCTMITPVSCSSYSLCLVLIFTMAARAVSPVPPEQQFRRAKQPSDDASVIELLKTNSSADEDLLEIDQLVLKLGAPKFQDREDAIVRLSRIGAVAIPALSRASIDGNTESRRNARRCIDLIEANPATNLAWAAVRLLIKRKPDGAVAALVRFAPYAADSDTEEEIGFGIDQIAEQKGHLDPALLAALQDRMPARRALAACIVGRRGNELQRAEVRKLLTDPHALVRLRAAQGLLAGKEKDCIPALIELVRHAPIEVAWQAEELLRYASGEQAPDKFVGSGSEWERTTCREAWESWWRTNGPKLDLAAVEKGHHRPGLLLLWGKTPAGKAILWLTGCDGTTRWKFEPKGQVRDAKMLPGAEFLLAVQGEGFTRRDPTGAVLRKYGETKEPISIHRLPNGRIFVAQAEENGLKANVFSQAGQSLSSRLLEHESIPGRNPKGAEQFIYRIVDAFPVDATRVWLQKIHYYSGSASRASFEEMDWPTEKQRILHYSGPSDRMQPLPDYRFAFAEPGWARVGIQADRKGTEWQCHVPDVRQALMLPNGNLLAVCAGRIQELSGPYQVVDEVVFESDIERARLCLSLLRLGLGRPKTTGVALSPSPEYWDKSLSSPHAWLRKRAAFYIGEYGPYASNAEPALTRLIRDGDAEVREMAGKALANVRSEQTLDLRTQLKNGNSAARRDAAQKLGRFVFHKPVTLSAVLNAYNDPDELVRVYAVWFLGGCHLEARTVVPVLISIAKENPGELRIHALNSLGSFQKQAAGAIAELLGMLRAAAPEKRSEIMSALVRIDPDNSNIVRALLRLLDDDYSRGTAALYLARTSVRADEVLPSLVRALNCDKDLFTDRAERQRGIIIDAMAALGPDAIPELEAVAGDFKRSLETRKNAIRALGAFRGLAQRSVLLLEDLRASLAELRLDIEQSLDRIRAD
jgi:HEAT repeat protein